MQVVSAAKSECLEKVPTKKGLNGKGTLLMLMWVFQNIICTIIYSIKIQFYQVSSLKLKLIVRIRPYCFQLVNLFTLNFKSVLLKENSKQLSNIVNLANMLLSSLECYFLIRSNKVTAKELSSFDSTNTNEIFIV